MRRFLQIFIVAAFAVAGVAAAGLLTPSQGAASPSGGAALLPTKVTVTMTDFKFKLSKKTVKTGTVIFTVVNKGKVAHDFKINGKKTKLLAPGKSAKLTVRFTKKGTFNYVCTVLGHAAAGMKGKLPVGTNVVVPPPPATTRADHRDAPGRPGSGRGSVRGERLRQLSHAGSRRRDRHRRPEPRHPEADPGNRASVRPERLHRRRRLDAGLHQPEPDGRQQHRGVHLRLHAPVEPSDRWRDARIPPPIISKVCFSR